MLYEAVAVSVHGGWWLVVVLLLDHHQADEESIIMLFDFPYARFVFCHCDYCYSLHRLCKALYMNTLNLDTLCPIIMYKMSNICHLQNASYASASIFWPRPVVAHSIYLAADQSPESGCTYIHIYEMSIIYCWLVLLRKLSFQCVARRVFFISHIFSVISLPSCQSHHHTRPGTSIISDGTGGDDERRRRTARVQNCKVVITCFGMKNFRRSSWILH